MSLKKLELLFDKLEVSIKDRILSDRFIAKNNCEENIENLQSQNQQLLLKLERKEAEVELLQTDLLTIFERLKKIMLELNNMIADE